MANLIQPSIQLQQNQEGPLDQYMKLVQLRQLVENQKYQRQMQPLQLQQEQQRTQMGAMQLKDHQAMSQAMQDWDGQDMNELPGLVLKRGGRHKRFSG